MSLGDDVHDPSRARAGGMLGAVWGRAAAVLWGEGERERTHRNALLAFAIRIASAAIAYMSQVLLARWMGSFEYGIFVLMWVWVLILGGFASLGLSTSTIRFVAEYRAQGQYALLRGLLLASRAIAVGVAIGLTAAGVTLLSLYGHLVESYYLLPAFLIVFCLPAYAMVDVQDGLSRGFAWIDVALVSPYILRPLLILLALLGAYLAGLPMTAVTAAGAALAACWAAAAMQTVALERRVHAVVQSGMRATRTGQWLKTSAPLLVVHGFELLMQNTDVLVLSRYVSPTEVAIYFAALKTIGLVAFVHFAVGTAAANRFSALKAVGDAHALGVIVRQAVHWTFWPTLAAVLVLLALGQPLLWLFGPEFTEGYSVMFILAAGFLVRAAVGPSEYILNMLGQQNACALVLSLAAVLNLSLNLALVPLYGIRGAAAATAISIAVSSLMMLMVARRRLGLNILVGR